MEQDSDDRDAPEGPDTPYTGAPGLPTALQLGNSNVFTVTDEDERGQVFWDLRGDDADDFVLTQGGTTNGGTQGSLSGPGRADSNGVR